MYVTDSYKVTGVGGIFFKSNDPQQSRNWYAEHLGLSINEYGSLFEYREGRNPEQKAYLQWSPFGTKTTYFEPSSKDFMINFRVGDLERLVSELQQNGVTVLDTIETYEYGKFVHILDPDSVKIELWQPADSTFTALYEGKTTK
ncbi:MAG: VOC family protein [Bacteroidetes bacterium]|nr:VOC family protein [Bacteroidota bacterium]